MCVLQEHGGICRGPNRSGGDSVSAVGEHRSEGPQTVVGYEGAAVGVAAVVSLHPSRLRLRRRVGK